MTFEELCDRVEVYLREEGHPFPKAAAVFNATNMPKEWERLVLERALQMTSASEPPSGEDADKSSSGPAAGGVEGEPGDGYAR